MEKQLNAEVLNNLAVLTDQEFVVNKPLNEDTRVVHSYHYHNAYEVYYLLSGDRYYFIKDKVYHAKKGALVMIKPYEIHCTNRYSNAPHERVIITFKKNFLTKLLNGYNINLFKCFDQDIHIVQFDFKEQVLAEALLQKMILDQENTDQLAQYSIQTSLVNLLLMATQSSEKQSLNTSGYKDISHKTIASIVSYINNNYQEDVTLKSISEKFFLSPCYVSRLFKKVTGGSFVDYLNGVRIKEAQKYLQKRGLTILDISLKVGFKNVTHFERVFKTALNTSPLKYRRIYTQ